MLRITDLVFHRLVELKIFFLPSLFLPLYHTQAHTHHTKTNIGRERPFQKFSCLENVILHQENFKKLPKFKPFSLATSLKTIALDKKVSKIKWGIEPKGEQEEEEEEEQQQQQQEQQLK